VVSDSRSPLLTVVALVASTQVGAGGNGQRLRVPIEKYPTKPFPPFDSKSNGVVSKSGLMIKKFGWNLAAEGVTQGRPLGPTQISLPTNTGSVTSSALFRFLL
jgi:hypothetical protein